jgi:hypothetical protein
MAKKIVTSQERKKVQMVCQLLSFCFSNNIKGIQVYQLEELAIEIINLKIKAYDWDEYIKNRILLQESIFKAGKRKYRVTVEETKN